ncbi:MAG TPA: hypothetical protein VGV37_29445 [Aliidongia sp.]|uniref:hypothetical protein n=1 Tax=Aliidongia sp. TaxID=1914230 RepID=UPI002DDCB162|nr:hypothetical protein [Aliidongia sp.]HEV2678689.1 hypothetical protein [Aliidongia sp.]
MREQAAIAIVAKHFSANRENGTGEAPDAYITIGGRRIAVTVAVIERAPADRRDLAKPRLRFDRVALRLVDRLRTALSASVPDGEAVVLTVTAPIRLPSKAAAALEGRVRDGLAHRSAPLAIDDTICGNQIRVRLVKGISGRTAKVIGFVHNRESDPDILLHLTQSMLRLAGAAAAKRPPENFTGDRWLVLDDQDGLPSVETYRQVYAQFAPSTDFRKILVVLAGGRVEALTE